MHATIQPLQLQILRFTWWLTLPPSLCPPIPIALTHTREKPHKCNKCNYLTTTAGKVRIHMLTHTRQQPHKCGACNRYFGKVHEKALFDKQWREATQVWTASAGNVERHLLVHGTDKPHTTCDQWKKHSIKLCIQFQIFFLNLQIFSHGYIRHIRNISQL